MELEKTISEWTKNNINAFDYYYSEYPFLKKFGLPVETQILQEFYINDYKRRNLKIDNNLVNNYGFLFSYFIANYEKPQTASSNSIERFIENIPAGFEKTIEQIGTTTKNVVSGLSESLFGMPIWLLITLIVAVIVIINKYVR